MFRHLGYPDNVWYVLVNHVACLDYTNQFIGSNDSELNPGCSHPGAAYLFDVQWLKCLILKFKYFNKVTIIIVLGKTQTKKKAKH